MSRLKSRRLALLGASGHGKVVADAALSSGWEAVDFFDDAWPARDRNSHWLVIGGSGDLVARLAQYDGVLVSIGDCQIRRDKHFMLAAVGAPLCTVVHPSASVSRYAVLGVGTVVMPGAVVNVDASVGVACIINTGANVDHDCVLGDAVHIAPGAHLSGQVEVGSCSWVGVGASVRQGIVVGARALVGAGAVVVKPVRDDEIVVGNPARLLPRLLS